MPTEAVIVVPDEFGVLVHGPPGAVDTMVERLLSGAGAESAGRSRMSAADVSAVGATGLALAGTAGEYLRMAPDSVARLQELGLDFTGPGVARDAAGHIKAHLNFETVSLGAEQALALQTAAVSMALRSAIADVQKAVERVEIKVDDINDKLDSRLQGDVIGTYRELLRVVTATNERGALLEEDWDGVAAVRMKISRDLEALRSYVLRKAKGLHAGLSVPKRDEKLKNFASKPGHVADVLDLIVVAEKSLQLYEYIRLQRVRSRDANLVGALIGESRRALEAQRTRDEELIDAVRAAIERAHVIEPLEVHRLFSKRDLDRHAHALDERLREFADASLLSSPDPLGAMPQASWGEAREEVGRRTAEAGHAVKELGGAAASSGADLAVKQARRAGKRVKRLF